jgi:hypothetical protein
LPGTDHGLSPDEVAALLDTKSKIGEYWNSGIMEYRGKTERKKSLP